MEEGTLEIDDISLYKRICGYRDKNLKTIEGIFDVHIIPRGNTFIVNADEERRTRVLRLLNVMGDYLHTRDAKFEFDDFDVKYLARTIASGQSIDPGEIDRLKILIQESGKSVVPRTLHQAQYISSMHRYPVTFGVGPAGTGKTYLAVTVGLHYLLTGRVERIILTRPAVEAGENLGFLPGDLIQKINPYLRPLYDALFDLLPFERITSLMEKGSIEIAPLAYMRGRTLNKAFVILDEAQNTTRSQMKMFLTRLGNKSRIVISGDVTQIDLEKASNSGMLHAMKILKDIEEISFIRFDKDDICRHPIVEKIVAAYDKHDTMDKSQKKS
ncbi:MAG TPA: PhoH family protein [Spirochaetota bacterium]|nr:PhoH family protein [Spirochaetota bacterium]HQO03390.1 PhoH family protein [Spirochaetota bacterium]